MLHLVKPLGFNIDDRSLKRAGLDYWPYVHVEVHESLQEFMETYKGRRMFLATTKGGRYYTEAEFQDEDMILLIQTSRRLNRIHAHHSSSSRIMWALAGLAGLTRSGSRSRSSTWAPLSMESSRSKISSGV